MTIVVNFQKIKDGNVKALYNQNSPSQKNYTPIEACSTALTRVIL